MAGIYIHIPFCGSFCTYCGFYSELCRNGGEMEFFVAALEKEAAAQRGFFKNLQDNSVKTLYFGGGTPSVLPPGLFGRIYSAVSRNFDLTGVEEFTVEVNPEDILEEGGAQKIRAWKECGVNRISMGVQSFSDTHLKFMRRRHDAQGVLRAFGILREAGFNNISIDLIFGYEGLSLSDWEYNLETAVRLAPEHISAYQMSIDGGSFLADMVDSGSYREPSAEVCAEQYALLQDMLQTAGYNQYEISNFCRPGFHSRHNSAYWDRVPYLGLGPAAHSFDGGAARFWNPS
ncbi:MAG: radical SAM family heme chaperone HemW, partial [Bacteroidales bacterium]|nr:radical SAM family heme chaperone HemW [Bacteroidales bacterium]